MKILIIGSEGFIGSHCITYFLQKGAYVTGVDLLVKPRGFGYTYLPHTVGNGFANLFKGGVYDACLNAFGNGSVPISISDPSFDFTANCSELLALLEAIRIYNSACKVIHLSSAAVYGSPNKLPVTEDSELKPMSPYGWHKMLSEQICKEYVKLYGLSISIVRPFSVYGPGLRKQLLWDIFKLSKKSSIIELWGTGNESRDFIFISDLMQAFDLLLARAPMKGELYNLASGIEISIRNIATSFCQLLKNEVNITFNGSERVGDPLNWKADMTKLMKLGFKQKICLEDGLKQTVKWIQNQ